MGYCRTRLYGERANALVLIYSVVARRLFLIKLTHRAPTVTSHFHTKSRPYLRRAIGHAAIFPREHVLSAEDCNSYASDGGRIAFRCKIGRIRDASN